MIKKHALLILAILLTLPLVEINAIRILHGPYLQNVSETEATIVWVTDSTSIGWVETAPDDGSEFYATSHPKFYDTAIGIKREARIHSVKLTGLRPGTRYRYRIYSQEVLKHASIHVHYGNLTATSAFQTPLPVFTTLDKNKPSTSFVVVNDIHGQKDMIASLLEKADYKQKDMVFFNGDMLSIFDNDEVRFFDGFMDTAVRMFAKEIPLYYVRGNHETRGQRATAFHDYVCPRKENLYFTVEQGPVFFICLDTGEDKPDTDIEYAGIVDYDNYRDEQVLWLKEIVASEAFKRAKYKIVVAHVQPQFDKDAWHGNLEVANKFVPILNEAGIDLMICGHLHKLVYSEPGPQMRFPLLINSNDMVVAAEANSQQLSIKVLDKEGKTTLSKIYH